MSFTKAQLLDILSDMPDSTEIVVPSIRNPAQSVTQIARHTLGLNPAGEMMLILVPANIIPFVPQVPEEASNENSTPPNPDDAA